MSCTIFDSRRIPWLSAVLLGIAALALPGCDDDSEGGPSTGDVDMADVGDTVGSDGADTSGAGGDSSSMECLASAAEDADGDGLPNGVEDTDLDCEVDPGETDWQNPDTDGDGLDDGQEDINGNGRVDEGEFDPRARDTDGNGIDDNLEPMAAVCLRDLIPTVSKGTSLAARTLLTAASDAFALAERGASAATFEVDGEVFGYVVRRPAQSSDVRQESGLALVALSQAGLPVLVEFQDAAFQTWGLSHPDPNVNLAPRSALRTQLDVGVPETTLPALRDRLAAALAGELGPAPGDPSAGPGCAPQEDAVLWQTTVVRDDGQAVVVGALACRGAMETETYFTVDDTTNTSMFAPTRATVSYQPDDGHCEQLSAIAQPRPVDFVWIIDTSGSMADEQVNVAAAADLFFETLIGSGADWRLGVATTEAWALDDPEIAANVDFAAHDPQLDADTGLVGEGFIDALLVEARSRFVEYVTVDRNCDREPPGSNICGYGLESGLLSGASVLARLETDPRPAYSLREDAVTAVIWVSDEEDQHFKERFGFEPLPTGDERDARLPEVIEPYAAREVLTCAIVGDQGRQSGGVCEPLPNDPAAVVGAQYGLGYIDVTSATNGFWGSICNDDLSVTIDSCVRAAIGVANRYVLAGRPLSATITVAVDGRVVERSRTQGWDYDAANNAIVFQGAGVLTPQSVITVSYREWEPTGG